MSQAQSKLETVRQYGRTQVDAQRAAILDAAESLFLQNGIEHTSMSEIAAAAGITRMSLYRYYPNRDVIAVEIHKRMLLKATALLDPPALDLSMESLRRMVRAMIGNFESLRDTYRFMGMFDQRYLDNPPGTPITQWTKDQLSIPGWSGFEALRGEQHDPNFDRMLVILNSVVWFLEKLALRGELTWSDRSIPLEDHLKMYEDLILSHLDRSANGPA